jgi:hypothetical protein
VPLIRDIVLNIPMEAVLRRLGKRENLGLKPEMKMILNELLDSLDNLHLLEPAIVYEFHIITTISFGGVVLENGIVLNGSLFNSILKSAKKLAAVVCTIGPRLEERVTYFSAQKDPLRALLLDGIGSAAVDSLVQKACDVIRHEASSLGYQASSRISPGIPGLPISEQWKVFRLVPGEQIGVHLSSSLLMIPRKSVSTLIGIGPDMPTWTEVERCNWCNLNKDCLYRVYFAPQGKKNT